MVTTNDSKLKFEPIIFVEGLTLIYCRGAYTNTYESMMRRNTFLENLFVTVKLIIVCEWVVVQVLVLVTKFDQNRTAHVLCLPLVDIESWRHWMCKRPDKTPWTLTSDPMIVLYNIHERKRCWWKSWFDPCDHQHQTNILTLLFIFQMSLLKLWPLYFDHDQYVASYSCHLRTHTTKWFSYYLLYKKKKKNIWNLYDFLAIKRPVASIRAFLWR